VQVVCERSIEGDIWVATFLHGATRAGKNTPALEGVKTPALECKEVRGTLCPFYVRDTRLIVIIKSNDSS
jgi:hypothetical protein